MGRYRVEKPLTFRSSSFTERTAACMLSWDQSFRCPVAIVAYVLHVQEKVHSVAISIQKDKYKALHAL